MTESYYEILDVAPGADEEEIESAYRSLIHEWHPDVSDHPDARERFLLIKEAREVLTDDAQRTRYDRVGHAEYTGDGSASGGRGGSSEDDSAGGRDERDSRDGRSRSDRSGGSGRGGGSGRNDGSDRRSSRRDRSAADEYRQRHQRKQSRQGRSRNDHRSGGRQSETRSTDAGGSGGRSGETAGGSTAETTTGGSTTETGTGSAHGDPGWGQPAATGSPLNPDVELLKYPALLVYWWLGSLVSPLLFAVALVPTYLQYRRMKYTDRILREGTSPEGWETVVRRLAVGVGVVVAGAVVLALDVGGATGEGLAVVALLLGLFLCLRYLKETLVRDWFNAEGTGQPVAWDAASRAPIVVLPLLIEAGMGDVLETAFLLAPPAVAIGYLLVTDRRSDVRAAIGL